jgi:NTP pyrophosphatase (non-canonical NTP hydrolase)
MSFREYQNEVHEWTQRSADQHDSSTSVILDLVGYVSDIAKVISYFSGVKHKKPEQELGENISNAMFALISIANSHGIDLDEAWKRAMDKRYTTGNEE